MSRKNNIKIMGIVNITDNSYFANSRCLNEDGNANLNLIGQKIENYLKEGADIIDIGACSTRPGSIGVGEQIEWKRLEPALDFIYKNFPNIKISIDTYWASIIEKTYNKIGDFIANDISAGEDDPKMLELVGKLGLTYIAMHKRGNPQTMQSLTNYGTEGVTNTIIKYFQDFTKKAEQYNITNWILDPGFGFAKTLEQNNQLLQNLGTFKDFNKQILVGISRKSMIFRRFNITPEESLPATQVFHYIALQNGADILRVHDVREAKQTIDIFQEFNHNTNK